MLHGYGLLIVSSYLYIVRIKITMNPVFYIIYKINELTKAHIRRRTEYRLLDR